MEEARSQTGRASAGLARWLGGLVQRLGLKRWTPIFTAAALTLTCISFPTPPPDNKMDPSWGGILNYAHQQNLQFGTELTYTYGPLGFLIFPYFSTNATGRLMAASVAMSFIACVGLCLLAWRLNVLLRWALLCCFAWAAANLHLRTDFILQTSLFC